MGALFIRDRLHERAHADLMVIHPGHEHGAGRPAERGRIVTGQLHAAFGDLADVGRACIGAVRAEAHETDIIEQHDQNVRPRPLSFSPPSLDLDGDSRIHRLRRRMGGRRNQEPAP